MTDSTKGYPRLAKSFKGSYPFKLGTTSFIYPDYFIPNVKMLGPYLDEIELLLFESDSVDCLLSRSVMAELILLSQRLHLTYNIHLPTDISISDPDSKKQQRAVEVLVKIIERTADLFPSTFALHVPYTDLSFRENTIRRWQDGVCHRLETVLATGIAPTKLALETLDFPIELIARIAERMQTTICLDIGHLIAHQYDIHSIFKTYAELISIIHLHGVDGRKDHLGLDQLPRSLLPTIMSILRKFTGTISLEVFCFEHLDVSLKFLERCWNREK